MCGGPAGAWTGRSGSRAGDRRSNPPSSGPPGRQQPLPRPRGCPDPPPRLSRPASPWADPRVTHRRRRGRRRPGQTRPPPRAPPLHLRGTHPSPPPPPARSTGPPVHPPRAHPLRRGLRDCPTVCPARHPANRLRPRRPPRRGSRREALARAPPTAPCPGRPSPPTPRGGQAAAMADAASHRRFPPGRPCAFAAQTSRRGDRDRRRDHWTGHLLSRCQRASHHHHLPPLSHGVLPREAEPRKIP